MTPTTIYSPRELQPILSREGAALLPISEPDLAGRLQELAHSLGAPVGHKHAHLATHLVEIQAGGAGYDGTRRPQSTPERQSAHTDGAFLAAPPDIVVLCGVDLAEYGGESILVHGRDLLIEALRVMEPQELSALFEPDCYRVFRGSTSYVRPVLSPSLDNKRIRLAFGTHEFNQVEVKPSARLAFELVRGLRCRYDLQQRFVLAPGDALFLSNATVLHGREAWYDTPSQRRRVIRLWVSAASQSATARLAGVEVESGPDELKLLLKYGLRRLKEPSKEAM